jgi:hypothetical protein
MSHFAVKSIVWNSETGTRDHKYLWLPRDKFRFIFRFPPYVVISIQANAWSSFSAPSEKMGRPNELTP